MKQYQINRQRYGISTYVLDDHAIRELDKRVQLISGAERYKRGIQALKDANLLKDLGNSVNYKLPNETV